jgi:hypothetical protein
MFYLAEYEKSVGHLKISVVAANDEKRETLEPQQV